ncbi:MAG: hypothetical protein ACRCZF_13890, partial [Gemmataceae bacterium]
ISARVEASTLTVQSRQEVDFNSLTLSTAIGAVPTLTEGTARRVPLGLFPAGLAPAPFLMAALALQPPMETWQLRFPRPLHEVEIRFAAPLVVPPVVHGAAVQEVPAPQQSAGRPRPDEAPLELIRPSLQARVQPDGQMVRITSGRVRTVGGGILPLDSLPLRLAWVGDKFTDSRPAGLAIPPASPPLGWPVELHAELPAPLQGMFPRLPTADFAQPTTWHLGPRYRHWPTLAPTVLIAPGSSTRVIDHRVLPVLSAIVCVLLIASGIVAWRARHWPAVLRILFFGLMLGTGAGTLLAPSDWRGILMPPGLVATLGFLAAAAHRQYARRTTLGSMATVFLGASGTAAAPAPVPIVIINNTAHVPVAFFDRLTARPPLSLVGLQYVGVADGPQAILTATIDLLAHRAEPPPFLLPLAGVQLESVLLDGQPAFPSALTPEQFQVPVRGIGRHRLEVRFAVPILVTGADREVRFTGPEHPSTQIRFEAGPGSRQLLAPTRRGELRQPSTTSLESDLGATRAVSLRWRQGAPILAAATVTAAEASVWDVDDDEHQLTTALTLRVDQGSVPRLRCELPPGLEPGRVTLRSSEGSNGLRDWTILPGPNGERVLNLGFQVPLEGRATIVLKLFPLAPLARRPSLRVPHWLDLPLTDRFVAVRLQRTSSDAWEKEALIDFPAEALLRDFAAVPELQLDRRPPTRAFRTEGTGVPRLRPTLKLPREPDPVQHELSWFLAPQAELEGTVRFLREGPQSVAEWELPAGVTLVDVRSPDLVNYHRSGDRVRAWFRNAAREVSVQYRAVRTIPTSGPVEFPWPAGVPAGVSAKFRWPEGTWATALNPGLLRTDAPIPAPANLEPLRLQLLPPPIDRPHSLHESLELRGTEFVYTARLKFPLRGSTGTTLTLAVNHLPADVRLELPSGISRTETVTSTGRQWQLTAPPGLGPELEIGLNARFPAAPRLRAPRLEVRLGGVASVQTLRSWTCPGGGYRREPRNREPGEFDIVWKESTKRLEPNTEREPEPIEP